MRMFNIMRGAIAPFLNSCSGYGTLVNPCQQIGVQYKLIVEMRQTGRERQRETESE